jgi:group I intron endonuclease
MYTVYFALNKTNGKAYAGMTNRTVRQRFWNHRRDANAGSQTHFHRALRKYDKAVWDVMVIWTGNSKEEAQQIERDAIAGMRLQDDRVGYNMTEGGDTGIGARIGHVTSEETKQKIRLGNEGRVRTAETRQRNADAARKTRNHLGHKHSEESKAKIKAATSMAVKAWWAARKQVNNQ